MQVDLSMFVRPNCSCGQSHDLSVKKIIIEKGALNQLPSLLGSNYLCPVIVCDDNTYEAAGARVQELLPKSELIRLKAEDLHADNCGVHEVMKEMKEKYDIVISVGAGTIHDICRYTAFEKKIPFVSVPTAASVDGFVSTVAAMTWDGLKQTLPAAAPTFVIADSDVFSKAPNRLTQSGISDLLGKYTAIADWKIAHLLTGEPICEYICDLEKRALEEVCQSMGQLREGENKAFESLMYALILSGLAMQMWGNSRPASGAEHHISHLWEMEVMNGTLDAYHGEKVSVGLMLTLEKYEQVKACILNNACEVKQYEGFESQLLNTYFGGKGLLDGIYKENTPDPLLQVDAAHLEKSLLEIAKILDELPSHGEVSELLDISGGMQTMGDAGMDSNLKELTLTLSPYVRNRLTFMRVLKMIAVR